MGVKRETGVLINEKKADFTFETGGRRSQKFKHSIQ